MVVLGQKILFTASGEASPKFWWAKSLTLSEQQDFVWDTASQRHKLVWYARNLEGAWSPLPPGYVYV